MPNTFFKSIKLFSFLLLNLSITMDLGCKKNNPATNTFLPANASKQQASSSLKMINPVDFVVDQSNVVLTDSNSYNINLAPMGQEFTPSLYSLDAIELKVEDATCSLGDSTGGSLRLILHEGTIDGKKIATSEAMHFPNCFRGILRFNFLAFVPVNPGSKYVMEAVHVSGNTSVLYMNEGPDNYYGGSFIMYGAKKQNKDLWFREGLFNFIARTKDQAKEIGWQKLVRRNGTPFKNQGDCIRYINTGH